jgi:1A family penicillin-binding protein
MAQRKSRRHGATTRPQDAFYEALPAALSAGPTTLPEVRQHFSETANLLVGALDVLHARLHRLHLDDWWQFQELTKLQASLLARRLTTLAGHGAQAAYRSLLWAGLSTTNTLLHAGQITLQAARLSAHTTTDFGPPIAADLGTAIGRTRKAITGRRARQVYLMLALGGTATLITVGTITAVNTINSYADDISSPAAMLAKKKTGTVILDRNGQVLFEGYGGQAADPVHLKDLPVTLKNATLAAEDPHFYDHPGFSWEATARAAWVDVTHGRNVQGGSTITQQLVKNSLLNSDRNYKRKYQELLLSMKLEHRYTKDQILEMYLNEIYYGEGSSGVAAASETYFHKSARELTLGESAMIAGLPLGPSRFDPNFDLEAAQGRRDYVLGRMADLGMITKSQAETAKAQQLQLAASGASASATPGASAELIYSKEVNIRAPHFVFYVLSQLRALYGDDAVEQGGITVRTSLDLTKQAVAEAAVKSHIDALADHHVTNGGLISLDPRTGEILAMVGSVDYNAPGFGNVNVTLSDLQPGSSFKPIAYATAFKKGWNGATTIDDAPVSFPDGSGQIYSPQNYDQKFHGTVTVRHALDNSLNIPAVKTLQFAGISDTIQTAHDMGITTLNDPSRYGLSLVLGGGEVRPIDMATVYATFDNNGTEVEPRSILTVSDRHGKDITKNTQPPAKSVLDPRVAFMITSILSDDSSRQPEFPANGPLTLGGRPAAAKTGTTNDFRDNWTVGYTPQLVTAVWVGNNDHTAMENVDGITGAAPIWHDYMMQASTGLPPLAFTQPDGLTVAKVCSDGGLADPNAPGTSNEVFLSDALPTKHCAVPVATPISGDRGKEHGPSQGPGAGGPPNGPPDRGIPTPEPPIVTPPFTPLPNPFQ